MAALALAPLSPARAAPPLPSLPAPIRIDAGCEPDYPPYCQITPQGEAEGFSVDLFRAALKAVGREARFKTAPWAELKDDLAEGRLQALPLVGRTPEREELFDFTFPYLAMHGTLVVRADNPDIRALDDLHGKQVAVMRGDNAEEFLRRNDPGARLVLRDSFETALRELSAGQHDAVVIQKLVAFQLMQQAGLTNLVTVGPQLFSQNICFAVREGDHALLDVLNEGLALVIADGTFRQFHAKWFAEIEAARRTRSRIVVSGDRNYPPYEFLDKNGQPAGFSVDLTRAIAREMGLLVDIQLGEWSVIRNHLETGRIDVLQDLIYSAERNRTFDFSPPTAIVQHGIAVRKGSPLPTSIQDVNGKSILVQKGDILDDLARLLGHADRIIAVASQEEALRRLSAGAADCALVARLPALNWIGKNGWDNIEVSSASILSAEYCYAVPAGNSELLALFSEGLAMLKASGEYRQIQAKWLGPYEETAFSLRKVLQIAAWVGLPLLALLLGAILWSRALHRQVESRTRDLRQANAFLDSIIENLPVMLFLKEARELRFVRVNRAGEELLGTPRTDLLGRNDYDFFPQDQADFFTAKDREVLQDRQPVDIPEEPLQTADKGERILHTRKVPVLDEQDQPVFLLGISEDITEWKRAGQKLADHDALLRIAGKTAAIGGWSVNLAENRVIWSDEVAAIHDQPAGYSPAVNEGISYYAPAWRDRIVQAFHACSTHGTPYDEIMEIITATGRRRWVRTIGEAVRDAQGKIVRVHGAFQDITPLKTADEERNRLQNQLSQMQKLESIGRLAGGVAHDFNNMLQAILGHAELALARLAPGQPLHADLLEIQKAAGRSADLTRQLLAFARKQAVMPRVLDLNQTIAGMLKMLGRLIGEDVTLVWHPGEALDPVKMDPSQIDQILANLCVNARDAMPSGGRLTIATENTALDEAFCALHPEAQPGAYVRLSVADTGTGMEPETLARLFEPFFTTKGLGQGTGLGLATVYGAVRQNNGFIQVTSQPGQGTCFQIFLPRQAAALGAASAAGPNEPILPGHETILLVEDEPVILGITRSLLEKMGYRVLAAASPAEACRLAEQHGPELDLLMTDVIMPGMNGRALAQTLQQRFPQLRCLFMSGYTANVIAHHGVLDKDVHFIQKPFTTGALSARLREALADRSRPGVSPE